MRLASLARVQFAAGDASTGLVFALGSVAALAVIIAVVGFVRRRSRPVGDQPRGQPSNWRWGQGGT
jgi:hypothetical protein